MTSEEKQLQGASLAMSYIQRVIGHISNWEEFVSLESKQHAIRIMKSRLRIYGRLLGQSETDKIELRINRDNGDLIQWYDKKHAIGRFNCQACLTDVDNSIGMLRFIRLNKLCEKCQNGIDHVTERLEDKKFFRCYKCDNCLMEHEEEVRDDLRGDNVSGDGKLVDPLGNEHMDTSSDTSRQSSERDRPIQTGDGAFFSLSRKVH